MPKFASDSMHGGLRSRPSKPTTVIVVGKNIGASVSATIDFRMMRRAYVERVRVGDVPRHDACGLNARGASLWCGAPHGVPDMCRATIAQRDVLVWATVAQIWQVRDLSPIIARVQFSARAIHGVHRGSVHVLPLESRVERCSLWWATGAHSCCQRPCSTRPCYNSPGDKSSLTATGRRNTHLCNSPLAR
jgi:hypothetical protein